MKAPIVYINEINFVYNKSKNTRHMYLFFSYCIKAVSTVYMIKAWLNHQSELFPVQSTKLLLMHVETSFVRAYFKHV